MLVLEKKRSREVTADDVKYSLERMLSKESFSSFVLADAIVGVSDYQNGKSNVSGIKVINPHEIQITLNQPESFFTGKLTSERVVIVPHEAVEQAGTGKIFGDTLVGTGPYRLVSGKDTEVILERNKRYWRKNWRQCRAHCLQSNQERTDKIL